MHVSTSPFSRYSCRPDQRSGRSRCPQPLCSSLRDRLRPLLSVVSPSVSPGRLLEFLFEKLLLRSARDYRVENGVLETEVFKLRLRDMALDLYRRVVDADLNRLFTYWQSAVGREIAESCQTWAQFLVQKRERAALIGSAELSLADGSTVTSRSQVRFFSSRSPIAWLSCP